MKLLRKTVHPDIKDIAKCSVLKRLATRAIAVRDELVLLLYTARYDDFSLPGGGLDEGEDHIAGMMRELKEETGAHNIREVKEFGIYEEYRPWYKPDFDIMHMISYCYTCQVDEVLGETSFEHYEINNGMKPMWINISEAIEHNERTMAQSTKKGLSIERETFLLKLLLK